MKYEKDFGPYATAADVIDWLEQIAPGLDLEMTVEESEDDDGEEFTVTLGKQ